MPSVYFVAQYVPDQTADERINFGVFVAGEDGRVLSQFLERWDRVEHFANGRDIGFLHSFARRAVAWDEATLRRNAQRRRNAIQFTAARGSILSAEDLLTDIAQAFLPRVSSKLGRVDVRCNGQPLSEALPV